MSFLPPSSPVTGHLLLAQSFGFSPSLKIHETKSQVLGARLLHDSRLLKKESAAFKRLSLLSRKLAELNPQEGSFGSKVIGLLSCFYDSPSLEACKKLLSQQIQLRLHLKAQNNLLFSETESFLKQWYECHLGEDLSYFPSPRHASFYLMKALCGGEKIWTELPVLDLTQTRHVKERMKQGESALQATAGNAGLIDYISASDMPYSLMRGEDAYHRLFIAIKEGERVQIFFERDNDNEDFLGLYTGCWFSAGDPILSLEREGVFITGRGNGDILKLRAFASKIKEIRECAL